MSLKPANESPAGLEFLERRHCCAALILSVFEVLPLELLGELGMEDGGAPRFAWRGWFGDRTARVHGPVPVPPARLVPPATRQGGLRDGQRQFHLHPVTGNGPQCGSEATLLELQPVVHRPARPRWPPSKDRPRNFERWMWLWLWLCRVRMQISIGLLNKFFQFLGGGALVFSSASFIAVASKTTAYGKKEARR